MFILSSRHGDIPIVHHMPEQYTHYQVPQTELYLGTKAGYGVFIFQQNDIGDATSWFINHVPAGKGSIFISQPGPAIVIQFCLLNRLRTVLEGIGELTLHERSFNIYYQPEVSAEYQFNKMEAGEFRIHLPIRALEGFQAGFPMLQRFIEAARKRIPTLLMSSNQPMNEELVKLLKKIEVNAIDRGAILNELISQAIQLIQTSPIRKAVKVNPIEIEAFYEIKEQIVDNMSSKFKLDLLTDVYGITKYKLGKYFKEVLHQSYEDYIKERRMLKAIDLLKNGESVRQIGEAVGYSDQGAFSKAFKKYYGTTPLHFRSQIKKNQKSSNAQPKNYR